MAWALTLVAALSQLYRNDLSRHDGSLLLLTDLINHTPGTNAETPQNYSRAKCIFLSAYTFKLLSEHVTCALYRVVKKNVFLAEERFKEGTTPTGV